jgi:hypothetical protein
MDPGECRWIDKRHWWCRINGQKTRNGFEGYEWIKLQGAGDVCHAGGAESGFCIAQVPAVQGVGLDTLLFLKAENQLVDELADYERREADFMTGVDLESVAVCRWPEDEFVVVLKGPSDTAKSVLRNTILDFSLIKLPFYDEPVKLRAGVSFYPEDGKSLDSILDLASWRLHNAKKGTDAVCFE